ncbi:MAG TPA: WD40 repeat domain-containing protein [Chloroflexia bacterium]|nr:WD40 repeat domain-containing protein [Chloroflexia bacterium]
MLHFRSRRIKYPHLLLVTSLLVALLLTACGDINPTPNQAAATPVPATKTPATTSLPAGTPTPAPGSLKKGRLKEIFPVLQKLPEASSVLIQYDWYGLGVTTDMYHVHYELGRQGNQFTGRVVFNNQVPHYPYYLEDDFKELIEEVKIPTDVMGRFLQTLADAPVYDGTYTGSPETQYTDNSPELTLIINTDSGPLTFHSDSQAEDFYPWKVSFAGHAYNVEDASPFGAYSLLKPYLKAEDLKPFLDSLTRNPVTTPPAIGTPQNPTLLSTVYTVPTVRSRPLIMAFSPDGKILVGVSEPGSVLTWNVSDGKLLSRYEEPAPIATAFSNTGSLRAAVRDKEPFSIKLYNNIGKELTSFNGHTDLVPALAFSPDGKILASGSLDRTVKLWEMPGGKLITALKRPPLQAYQIFALAFSPDGKILASAGSGDSINNQYPVILWDVASGKEIGTLPGHNRLVTSLAFSPDGKTLISGGKDKTILWNIAAKKEQLALTGPTAIKVLRISPDSRLLAGIYENGQLNIWEAASGKVLYSNAAQPGDAADATTLAFSPDGKYLAVMGGGEKEGTLRLWKLNL